MGGSIRAQCNRMYKLALENKLDFFTVNDKNFSHCVDTVEQVIRDAHPSQHIPAHSRLRHFDAQILIEKWDCDNIEKARRLVDLVTVSVLLDAGAGSVWKYVTSDGAQCRASEGLCKATV